MRALIAAAWAVERQIEQQLEGRFGLTYPQYATLEALHRLGGNASLGRIAMDLQCSRGNLTGVVDRLERMGWIERQRSTEDRRVIYIRCTDMQRMAHVIVFVEGCCPVKLSTAVEQHLLEIMGQLEVMTNAQGTAR